MSLSLKNVQIYVYKILLNLFNIILHNPFMWNINCFMHYILSDQTCNENRFFNTVENTFKKYHTCLRHIYVTVLDTCPVRV